MRRGRRAPRRPGLRCGPPPGRRVRRAQRARARPRPAPGSSAGGRLPGCTEGVTRTRREGLTPGVKSDPAARAAGPGPATQPCSVSFDRSRGVPVIAVVPSATLLGVDGRPVAVEAHVSNGLPGFHVVGLPDTACRESRDRVRAALLSSGLPWPMRRVTVNLAPSGMRKAGAGLDLPIAVALLLAAAELPADAVVDTAFIGELGLDGSIRRVPGILSLVDALDTETVVVAPDCRREAALVGRHRVREAAGLRQLVDVLRGEAAWPDATDADPPALASSEPEPDLADVRGQRFARWALELAAAG